MTCLAAAGSIPVELYVPLLWLHALHVAEVNSMLAALQTDDTHVYK